MLGHHHQPDQRKLIPQTNFAENIKEEVARADRTEQWQTAITTAGDEMQVVVTVAALEACRRERNTSKPPTPSNIEGMGHPRRIK